MDGKRIRIIVTLAFALGAVAQAHAIPQLRLTTSTGATVTVVDEGLGDSGAGVAGLVIYNGALGDWNINVTTGVSRPALGSELLPILDLASFNMTSGAAGSITLELTDTGFAPQPTGAHVGAEIGGTTSGSVRFQTFFDAGNAAFGQGTLLTDATYSSSPFAGTGWNDITALNPYSLTLLVKLTHDSGFWQMSSFDATVKVPEPSTLLLLGIGIFGLGLLLRRRGSIAKRA